MQQGYAIMRKLFRWEFAAQHIGQVPVNLYNKAKARGYNNSFYAMIHQFKEVGAKRELINGVNHNLESVSLFRAEVAHHLSEVVVINNCEDIQVACLCNAAVCCAEMNGNMPTLGTRLLYRALQVIEQTKEEDRNDDWWAVYERLCLLMRLNGCLKHNDKNWLRALDSMTKNSAMLGLHVITVLEELKRRDKSEALVTKRSKEQALRWSRALSNWE